MESVTLKEIKTQRAVQPDSSCRKQTDMLLIHGKQSPCTFGFVYSINVSPFSYFKYFKVSE